MSKVAIIGNASGTGVFTVASPNSNVDRVLTLPDVSGTVDTLQRSGNVIQVVNFQTGAVATGTTVMPVDDTIPQITEGDEYMTLAITPTNANNILIIDVFATLSTDVDNPHILAALFVGATANALAAVHYFNHATDTIQVVSFKHRVIAGVTSALTFRVRGGIAEVGTTTFNGYAGGRRLGGSLSSSITITEYTP
jgi:hypothetical protein